MTYAVVTTERAAQEISDAAAWWAAERSVEQAIRWYDGIRQAIARLADSPEARPLAAEHADFGCKLRPCFRALGKDWRLPFVLLLRVAQAALTDR